MVQKVSQFKIVPDKNALEKVCKVKLVLSNTVTRIASYCASSIECSHHSR